MKLLSTVLCLCVLFVATVAMADAPACCPAAPGVAADCQRCRLLPPLFHHKQVVKEQAKVCAPAVCTPVKPCAPVKVCAPCKPAPAPCAPVKVCAPAACAPAKACVAKERCGIFARLKARRCRCG